MEFSHLILQKIIGGGCQVKVAQHRSGSKYNGGWGTPWLILKITFEWKKHANIHAKWTNPCKITFKWKHLKILEKHSNKKSFHSCKYIYISITFKHTFSMHLEISPCVPLIHGTLQTNCAYYTQWSCLANFFPETTANFGNWKIFR